MSTLLDTVGGSRIDCPTMWKELLKETVEPVPRQLPSMCVRVLR